jgi:DNA repair exonuclease SbcCD ATPase subunit
MFQQRLKHLRFHQQDEIVELKTDAELALKLEEDQHRLTEAEIKKDKRTLKVNMKEAEVAQEDFIRMLKLEQDQKMMELRQEFDSKARDLQQKYTQKMKTIRDQMETNRKNEILRIDDEKNKHIRSAMDKNQKEFQDIKVYYGDITSSNLDMIKRLKEEHEEIKKRSASDSKHMLDLKQKNTQLSEPLRRADRDVSALQEELRLYEVDKKRLAEVKEKIKDQEKTYSRLQFQQEALYQHLERVQKDRDDVYEKFSGSVYEVQQKSGLKNLLLEKKLDTINESLEITMAQVGELVMSGSADQVPGAISQRLDELIEYKNEFIAYLHEEVQRIQDAYKQMVRAYQAKLAEYGIPAEELGFVPAD